MRNDQREHWAAFPPSHYSAISPGRLGRFFPLTLWCAWIFCCVLMVACGEGQKAGQAEKEDQRVVADTATHGKTMEELLNDYDHQKGRQRLATANKVFGVVYRHELSDSLLTATPQMAADSVSLLVWYWACEYFFDTQAYRQGLAYAKRALPLLNGSHDMSLKSDCENVTALLYFRQSDYVRAIEHARRSLDYERQLGDNSRISSSLNTLAGICLVAKQLDDGERYVKEALQFSTAAGDSTRMAIQHGMASEIYHAMGKNLRALEEARRAYALDSMRHNTAKMGIRLSQMGEAEKSLGRYAEAERHVRLAMPILAATGNRTSLAICHNQMGEMLCRRGTNAEAAKYFRLAAMSFAERNDMYNESRALLGLYEAMKDDQPKEAAAHLRRYALLKDSIYQHNLEQAVSQYKVKYETDELVHQREHDKVERRANLVVAFILVVGLLLIIVWLINLGRVRHRRLKMLRQVSQMRTRFFTNITHEFRTPLTLIIGLSHDLAGNELCPKEAREMALTIHRQGNSLLELINQLLDVAKVRSAIGNANWRNGNVTAYVTMIVESYRDYAQKRNIALQFIPRESVVMDFVPDYMSKIINNLLSNSLKFTPAYGRIGVTMWREGNRLRIDVTDTGKGMDKETMTHVFEPFFQAESDTKNIGTGIGLALVKQIVNALSGTIDVESTLGKGTTLRISLPIHNNVKRKLKTAGSPATAAAPAASVRPLPKKRLEDSNGEDYDCRLLVVEDNTDVAAYIGSQLSAMGRYAISYASNGREGLEEALELVPDLIITDLMMPEMDGLELCRQVRANDIINHVPVIIVTAKITEEERIKGLQAGADAYLTKPFNADELRTRVEKLLEGREMLREKFASGMAGSVAVLPQTEGTPVGNADLRFLNKVADVVYAQILDNKPTGVSLIASKMCMSNSQFYRKMVAVTGQTPMAYIQRVKIKKAMKMLDEDDKTGLSEVAERCGFDVYPNFVRAFKKVCDMTPTDYRKRKRL